MFGFADSAGSRFRQSRRIGPDAYWWRPKLGGLWAFANKKPGTLLVLVDVRASF